jgi:hypothetical protein
MLNDTATKVKAIKEYADGEGKQKKNLGDAIKKLLKTKKTSRISKTSLRIKRVGKSSLVLISRPLVI